MKIAHIICTFPPYKGGMGSVAHNFAKISKNHKVTIFTPNYSNIAHSDKYDFEVIRLKPFLKYGNGAFLPQLFFKLKEFDIIHLHYPFFGGAEIVYLAKLFYKNKFKLIIHYHMDVEKKSILFKLLSIPSKLLFNLLFNKADSITCASLDYIKNSKLSKFYSKNKEKFHEISFGVDTDFFFPLYKKVVQYPIKLLFVGGLDKAHYFKGVNVLFKAVSLINLEKWKLKIIGDGELKRNYIKKAKKLEILSNVEFLSEVNNEKLSNFYRKSDLFILPSINQNEAFGIVLLEAMASGLPVIASNLPGVRFVFKKGREGLLAEPNKAEDLKEKILELINNREKIVQMGENARQLSLKKYSWKKISHELEKIYV